VGHCGLQAVIFDVDGTLVDSERDGHRVAFNLAFEDAGLEDRWDAETYGRLLAVTGGQSRLRHYLLDLRAGLPEGVDRVEVDALAAELHRTKTQYFTDMVRTSSIPARPGVTRLLDELCAERVPVGVATTGSSEWVGPLLENLFGRDRFAEVVTGEDVAARKPEPDAYLLALHQLGVAAGGVVAVEDSGPGLTSARRAGLACVVVANSYTDVDDVTEADVLLDGFGEPQAGAAVLADRYSTTPGGVVDVASLRRLIDRAGATG
jgi:HAD superfamily hydrolase (TIGR01509 family)